MQGCSTADCLTSSLDFPSPPGGIGSDNVRVRCPLRGSRQSSAVSLPTFNLQPSTFQFTILKSRQPSQWRATGQRPPGAVTPAGFMTIDHNGRSRAAANSRTARCAKSWTTAHGRERRAVLFHSSARSPEAACYPFTQGVPMC